MCFTTNAVTINTTPKRRTINYNHDKLKPNKPNSKIIDKWSSGTAESLDDQINVEALSLRYYACEWRRRKWSIGWNKPYAVGVLQRNELFAWFMLCFSLVVVVVVRLKFMWECMCKCCNHTRNFRIFKQINIFDIIRKSEKSQPTTKNSTYTQRESQHSIFHMLQ